MIKAILFGVPRSGTSWVGAMLAAHPDLAYRFQPLHSHSFQNTLKPDSTKQQIERFFSDLKESQDPYVLRISLSDDDSRQAGLQKKTSTPKVIMFKEVHDFPSIANCVETDPSIRLIGLIRDPREVLASWIQVDKEWDSSWSIDDEWYRANKKNSEYLGNHFGLSEWIRTTTELKRLRLEYPGRVIVLKYSEVKANPQLCVKAGLDLLGLSPAPELGSFIDLTQRESSEDKYSVFRAKQTPNLGVVSDQILDEIDKIAVQSGFGEFLQ
jgi:hypothetical protein